MALQYTACPELLRCASIAERKNGLYYGLYCPEPLARLRHP